MEGTLTMSCEPRIISTIWTRKRRLWPTRSKVRMRNKRTLDWSTWLICRIRIPSADNLECLVCQRRQWRCKVRGETYSFLLCSNKWARAVRDKRTGTSMPSVNVSMSISRESATKIQRLTPSRWHIKPVRRAWNHQYTQQDAFQS